MKRHLNLFPPSSSPDVGALNMGMKKAKLETPVKKSGKLSSNSPLDGVLALISTSGSRVSGLPHRSGSSVDGISVDSGSSPFSTPLVKGKIGHAGVRSARGKSSSLEEKGAASGGLFGRKSTAPKEEQKGYGHVINFPSLYAKGVARNVCASTLTIRVPLRKPTDSLSGRHL